MATERKEYTHKEGYGSLRKSTRKEPGSNQPDYYGGCCANGVQYDIAGWIKQNDHGSYMSLSVKPKEARRDAQRDQVKPQADTRPPFDDDVTEIPF